MSQPSSATFASGSLYKGDAAIEDLKASGFSTVLAWSIHVNLQGDLIYNDPPAIVSGGKYVGDPAFPPRLARLKEGGSVKRLEFSVGSGPPPQDFHHIQQLIQEGGTGPGSILYENFSALKAAIPAIDGIDLDDEDLNDQPTVVAFSQMLYTLGFAVTFCPFIGPDFWADCLKALNGPTPGLVRRFHLQCYDGGSGNRDDLQPWIDAIAQRMGPDFDAKGFVSPGLRCVFTDRFNPNCTGGDCPADFEAQFRVWKSLGIRGGWLWQYDDVAKCQAAGRCQGPSGAQAYADAILAGLSD